MPAFVSIRDDGGVEAPIRVRVCNSFACRLRGLMFRSNLPRDEGVLLVMPRESRLDTSIHMLFVPFNLAVFWIDNRLEVVDKIIAKAWRPAYFPNRAARYVLEIHPGFFDAFEIGSKVSFVNG
jgi:uncharacterized membrane protein (UPF0127 family)